MTFAVDWALNTNYLSIYLPVSTEVGMGGRGVVDAVTAAKSPKVSTKRGWVGGVGGGEWVGVVDEVIACVHTNKVN